MREKADLRTVRCASRHHRLAGGRSLRAEILILTARINFNP
jgi:hypothetical protein